MRFQIGGAEVIDRRYIMQRQLGKGGMGAVYEAFDRLTQEAVALKLVTKPPSELDFASRAEGLNLYLALAQEFKVLASLRHPQIISVLNYGFDDQKRPYFTMDLLQDALSPARAIQGKTSADKVQLLIQILQALSYFHRRGILHRDLKPANVRVVNGVVKVLDFGLATLYKQETVNTERIVGTIEYMAPELLRQQPPSIKSDLYALGVMGWELFTGQYLFDSTDVRELARQIFHKIPDPSVVGNDRVAAVLSRLMAKNPDDRYDSADDTIQAFAEAIGQPAPVETAAIRESFLQAAAFVGREREMDDLGGYLRYTIDNKQGGTILIGGESGVGKSRLLDELRIRATVQGVLVLRGEGVSTGRSAYQVWRNVLRTLVLSCQISEEEAGILQSVVPEIGRLLSIKPGEVAELDPEDAQRRLIHLVGKLIQQQTEPVLIILEDLHWEGPESAALLNHLIQLAPQMPLLILVSYRDDETPDLPNAFPEATHMRLQRLDNTGIEELATAMLGERGRSPHLLKFLQQETEGNVFFVVEIVRALAEEAGKLDDVSSMQLPTHIITGGVDQVIQRRLGRVPDEIHPLLQFSAYSGRYLDLRLLNHILKDQRLEHWLTICANAAVLDLDGGRWRFAHEKLREGVLMYTPEEDKAYINRRIAQAIEDLYLDTAAGQEYFTALAYHWAMAENTEKEGHYAALAGEQVLKGGAYREAVVYLERALELIEPEPDSGIAKKQATLTRQLGTAYLNLGNYRKAKQVFEASLQTYQTVGYTWGVAYALSDLGHTSYHMQAYEESYRYFKKAIETAMSVRAQKVALDAVVGIARLMTAAKKYDWAIELVAFTLDHMAVDRQTAVRAEDLLKTLKDLSDPQVFEDSLERGRRKTLSSVVEELL
jgi:tetratricopeptide (TPR) repeat protein